MAYMIKTANFIGLIKAAQGTAPATGYGRRMGMDEWKDAERARLHDLDYEPDQIETMLTNKAYRQSNGGRNYVSTKGFKVRSKTPQHYPGIDNVTVEPYTEQANTAATSVGNTPYTPSQMMSAAGINKGILTRMGYAQSQGNVAAQQPAAQPAAITGGRSSRPSAETNYMDLVMNPVEAPAAQPAYAGRPMITSVDKRYEDPFSSSNIQFPVGNFDAPMRGEGSDEYTAGYGMQSNARRDAGLLNLFDSRNKA